MSSSRTAPPGAPMYPGSGLVGLLGRVPDPRDPRGVRHALPGLLAVGVAAVLAGARSFAAIGEWASETPTGLLAELGVSRSKGPSESAIRRAFARVDADVLDAVVGAFCWTRTGVVSGRRVIALDGKTVRGARTPTTVAPHLVAAFDHTAGTVLGQVATAAKSNEIPAVRDLLGLFDLNEVVVTVDAMHTQTDTAELIVGAGGDYVFTVKSNQPSLYAACKNLPWAQVTSHTAVSTTHGRRARRTIKAVAAPTWVTFAHAAQVAQIRRTTTRAGRRTVEVVYVITSADHRTPAGHPRLVGAPALGHRELPALGPRRHLRRRPLPGPHRQCPTRDGHPPQHRHQPAPPRRMDHHRRRPTTSRPQPPPDRHTPPDLLKHDFAEALLTPSPAMSRITRRLHAAERHSRAHPKPGVKRPL
jgi:predicted transposase YbfD/YdcC